MTWRKVMTKLDSILKSRDVALPTKIHPVNSDNSFPSVRQEPSFGPWKGPPSCNSWIIMKPEHQRIDAFRMFCWRRLLRVPWTAENKPTNPKGNQPQIFIGRTDAEAEAPILWPPDVRSWLIWKDPDPGKGWRWKEKGTREDVMVGWHYRLNGHEFE